MCVNNEELDLIFDVPDEMILNPEDISKLVGMHVESVRRWCREGKLESYCLETNILLLVKNLKSL